MAQRSPSRLDPLELRAWSGLLVTHRRFWGTLEERLKEHRLSTREYDVLAVLDMVRTRRMRMSDLADRIALSPSRLTRVIGAMEERGFVARQPDPDDGRVQHVALAELGLQRLRAARIVHHEVLRSVVLGHLDERDLRALGRMWEKAGSVDPLLEDPYGS